MKKIDISVNGINTILYDSDNDEPLEEYSEKLSKAFTSTNVVILETSDSSFIVRPHKLDSIKVESIIDSESEPVEEEPEEKAEEPEEDIITDAD